jgi:signal peptidase I
MNPSKTQNPVNETFALFQFQGYSMAPMVRPGDRLIVEKGPQMTVRLGDVVLFKNDQAVNTEGLTAHRVIQIDAGHRFITKGDNLTRPDLGFKVMEDITGRAVALIRKKRLWPLNKGLYGGLGKVMARSSRRNITPGILLSRLKGLAGFFK